ncbi:hypothetical protein H5410_051656 [Solanum commersonii]|uniref:Uncharacterized protein n=1 Tax=Solanum commersonii TaxID=4109 RepID=A0A9J5X0Q5_SOLCO|nr:hypothetical protein H5410_051656 [Solanum commersonii]
MLGGSSFFEGHLDLSSLLAIESHVPVGSEVGHGAYDRFFLVMVSKSVARLDIMKRVSQAQCSGLEVVLGLAEIAKEGHHILHTGLQTADFYIIVDSLTTSLGCAPGGD